jgi:hypothetical protein
VVPDQRVGVCDDSERRVLGEGLACRGALYTNYGDRDRTKPSPKRNSARSSPDRCPHIYRASFSNTIVQ